MLKAVATIEKNIKTYKLRIVHPCDKRTTRGLHVVDLWATRRRHTRYTYDDGTENDINYFYLCSNLRQ